MLKRLISYGIIILLFVIVANAQSQQPIPGRGVRSNPPQIKTTNKQQPAEADKRGTEQSPFIVKTINPPKTKTEAEQERKKHEEKASQDWWLVRYTGILAFVAIFQFGALILQAIYLNKGFQATQKAADAANISAKALQTSERAYIFSRIKIEDRSQTESGDIIFNAALYIKNHGRTPAIIKEVVFKGDISKNCPIKDTLSEPHYPIESFVGNSEEPYEDRWHFHIKEEQWRNLITINPTVKVYCFGYVKYVTIFNKEYCCHSFCWEFDSPSRQFALCPESELNYNT